MKARIFMLTRNEQRVVVLIIMVLLTAAFVRYWREARWAPESNSPAQSPSIATPFPEPAEETQPNDAAETPSSNKSRVPSP